MKKEYVNASLEIVNFYACDIVTASGTPTGDNDVDGSGEW